MISRRGLSMLRSQRGMALLIMLVALIMGGAYLLVSQLNRARNDIDRNKKTADVLAQAKEALIGYAVTYYDSNAGEFGFLPCPDLSVTGTSEGISEGNCGTQDVSRVGRLPWRSLGLEALRDGSGECLWYAVSGGYKNGSAKTDMLNDDTNGMFQVFDSNGTQLVGPTPESRAVVVIIAPGAPVGAQNRNTLATGTETCGGNYTASNYLEARNSIDNSVVSTVADTIVNFVTATDRTTAIDTGAVAPFNDRILYITQAELWNAVKRRNDFTTKIGAMAGAVRNCVQTFGNTAGVVPWPATVNLPNYHLDSAYNDDGTTMYGRLPDIVDSSGGTTLVSGCIPPGENLTLWKNWKDHLFLAISDQYKPGSTGTPSCANPGAACVSVVGMKYPAVVIFSDARLAVQTRNVFPDTVTKSAISNYVESTNLSSYPNTSGDNTFADGTSATFNDDIYPVDGSGFPPPSGGMGGGGGGGGMGGGGMGGGMGGGGAMGGGGGGM